MFKTELVLSLTTFYKVWSIYKIYEESAIFPDFNKLILLASADNKSYVCPLSF